MSEIYPLKGEYAEYAYYAPDKGEVLAVDRFIQEAILVRAGLMDRLVREACIAELERLGYTVTAPEAPS